MIKIEKTAIYGWEQAIRGMRNPFDSWAKSDSDFTAEPILGENDLKLATKLANAGTDHGKFLRFLNVYADVTAPLYWWKEADTYKVGTVANSCSTMHRIQAKQFTRNDFSIEHLDTKSLDVMDYTIEVLNYYRDKFNTTKDKQYWWQMIQLLPSSYNQKRTFECNYQVLRNMLASRADHRLDEWHDFCRWILDLPYADEFIRCADR